MVDKLIGVAAALAAQKDSSFVYSPQAFSEYSQDGRVAFITGANRGLGLEAALALFEAGARAVYCVDLLPEPGESWHAVRDYTQKIRTGGKFEYVQCDVTSQEKIWAVAEMIVAKEGRLDVAVAGAGITGDFTPPEDISAEAFNRVQNVNLSGTLYTAQAAFRQMNKLGQPGNIILMASLGGSLHIKGLPVIGYQTSKAGVIQMARSLACEFAPKGVRVNSVSPGWFLTEMTSPLGPEEHARLAELTPMNRMGKPSEIRGTLLWLASDASSYCTGSDIMIDGGLHAW